MSTTKLAIRAENLTLRRDDALILDGISLAIPSGAVVGLVGRNGSGKSSLLRCLAGLTEPTAGSSSILDCPSLVLTDAVRERLGYVAQSPDLFESMQVLEHLQMIGRAYPRWNEDHCLALAVRLDLPCWKQVRELSVGDQQKMAVVLALAHDPDLLLLDEPVASLDPMSRREFMRAMFGGREHGERTVIISSHILTDLERVVSHVAFMRRGRIELFDTWDAMLEHLRLVPADSHALPPEAIVSSMPNAAHVVIDIRRAPGQAQHGRALTLDELFAEFNA
jgi:ABC-2 type transport system ATP-binding protein